MDFAARQVEHRNGRTSEAFDVASGSADTCRELIADLLLMGGPSGRCASCQEGARRWGMSLSLAGGIDEDRPFSYSRLNDLEIEDIWVNWQ